MIYITDSCVLMKNITLTLFLLFYSYSSYGFDNFDAMVCEATVNDESRISCYRSFGFESGCKKEHSNELECYRNEVKLVTAHEKEKTINTVKSPENLSENITPVTTPVLSPIAISKNNNESYDLPTGLSKETFDAIRIGMSKEQIKKMLGEPETISESVIEGFGKSELWQYQKGGIILKIKAITVFFTNGYVSDKVWNEI